MKKLFLAICFNLLWAQVPQAKVTEVLDQSQLPQGEMPQQDKVEVKPVSAEELSAFLSERLERTVIQPKDKVKTKATDANKRSRQLTNLKKAPSRKFMNRLYNGWNNKMPPRLPGRISTRRSCRIRPNNSARRGRRRIFRSSGLFCRQTDSLFWSRPENIFPT